MVRNFFAGICLLIIFLFPGRGISQVLNPSAGYNAGDFVLDSFQVYNEQNQALDFKIPSDCHLIIFRYSWHDIGKGVDTQDSIAELQKRIKTIIAERAFECTQLVVVSYDRGKDFIAWQEHIKNNSPFKNNEGYDIQYLNTSGNNAVELRLKKLLSKVMIISPNGRILRLSSFISRFNYPKKSRIETVFRGKLIGETDGLNEPLNNAKVSLTSKIEKDTIASGFTNQQGEFELRFQGNEADYQMHVKPANENTTNITLATPDGREISKMTKSATGFEYHLLKQEIILLSEMKDEDVVLKYESFIKSSKKELLTAEDIYYESGKSEIMEESVPTLDKIVKLMTDHPEIKLEITSHTDAVGEDNSNLTLSQKRAEAVADYLVQKGIATNRLNTAGKGETQIRNRCKNGTDCSDKEHAYNRRTEFLFYKEL